MGNETSRDDKYVPEEHTFFKEAPSYEECRCALISFKYVETLFNKHNDEKLIKDLRKYRNILEKMEKLLRYSEVRKEFEEIETKRRDIVNKIEKINLENDLFVRSYIRKLKELETISNDPYKDLPELEDVSEEERKKIKSKRKSKNEDNLNDLDDNLNNMFKDY
jgi:hypothetical protein